MEPVPMVRKKKGKKSKIQRVIEEYEFEIKRLHGEIDLIQDLIVWLKEKE